MRAGRSREAIDTDMDRELLIEIGVEELPASWLPGLTRQLGEALEARLNELRIAPRRADRELQHAAPAHRHASARIAERQEDLEETITGPPVSAAFEADGQPTPAALGFAKKQGVDVRADHPHADAEGRVPRLPEASARQERRGHAAGRADRRSCATWRSPSRCTGTPGSTTAGASLVFGRPIRWLLFLYGGRVVPFTIGRAADMRAGPLVQDIESGALTYGHRFLATSGRAGRSIKVRSFEEYQRPADRALRRARPRRAARSHRPRARVARAPARRRACS